MGSFSVVIPLIPVHDKEIYRILPYLAANNDWIKEVIICRSETPAHQIKKVEKKFLKWANKFDLGVPLILSSVSHVAYDGTNRNRGMSRSSGELIAFLDSDDRYAPGMFRVLNEIFALTSAKAILHSYAMDNEAMDSSFEFMPTKLKKLVYSKEATPLEFTHPIQAEGESDLPKIHHAHLTVRRTSITEEYLDIFPGADTEFCKRLILSGVEVLHVDQKLSYWNRNRSIRYRLRRLRFKFFKKDGL